MYFYCGYGKQQLMAYLKRSYSLKTHLLQLNIKFSHMTLWLHEFFVIVNFSQCGN